MGAHNKPATAANPPAPKAAAAAAATASPTWEAPPGTWRQAHGRTSGSHRRRKVTGDKQTRSSADNLCTATEASPEG